MFQDKITEFISNIGNEKKIIEIKFGKIINSNVFNINIDEILINKIVRKFKNYNNKYYNDRIYYYNNLQMIVNKNGEIKCYKDNLYIDKSDISISNIDMRILTHNRIKLEEIDFPCQKVYDLIHNRELFSIILRDNLRLNIYNKTIENNIKNNYEVSIQYLYNPYKNDNIKDNINFICSIIEKINTL